MTPLPDRPCDHEQTRFPVFPAMDVAYVIYFVNGSHLDSGTNGVEPRL